MFPQIEQSNLGDCTTLGQIIQIVIISLSLLCCLYTFYKIIANGLLCKQYAFLIFAAQLCFTVIGAIDLFSKLFPPQPDNESSKLWCGMVTPIVYGLILSTFLLIELFCVIFYRKMMGFGRSFFERYIKTSCLVIVLFNIGINFVGFRYFEFGLCRNCTLTKKQTQQKDVMKAIAETIIYIDYFFPLIFAIYIIILVCKLNNRFKNQPHDRKKFKILWIPLGNAVLLVLNNVLSSGFIPYEEASTQVRVILYESLYYVPLVNTFFYYFFARAFQLDKAIKRGVRQDHSLLVTFTDNSERESQSMVIGFRY